jgi:hypothetical protein
MDRRLLIAVSFLLLAVIVLAPACSKKSTKQKAEEAAKPLIEATPGPMNASCKLPLVQLGVECCLDENNNTQCDKYEKACGNNVCDAGENECTCPLDCGQCETKQAGSCQQFTCRNDLCVVEQAPFCCGDGTCLATESCSSCFQDCCILNPAKDDLLDFEAMAKSWDIVVGDDAPPKDVAISADILTAMQRYLVKRLQQNVSVGKGILASEATPYLKMKDHIVLGNPCQNSLAQEVMRREIVANYDPANESNQSCQIFLPGESMIKLVPTSDSAVSLYVGGYSWRETEAAAQILIQQAESNNTRHNLNGREFRILGNKTTARIVTVI